MTRLSHQQARQYIQQATDGMLRTDQIRDLNMHLRECETCRAESEELDMLARHLQSEFRARWDPQDGPTRNVMARIHSQTGRISMTNRINLGLKTFAAILAFTLVGIALSYVIGQLHITSNNNPASSTGLTPYQSTGRLIAFVSDRDGNSEIYVMNVDGTNQRNLTNSPAEDNSPVWSPDGTRLAFISDRLGQPQIFAMNPDGSNVVQLTNVSDTQSWWPPDWSSDGKWLVATRIPTKMAWIDKGQVNLYVISADGSGATQITTNEVGNDYAPRWSPDGKSIAFIRFSYNSPTKIYSVNPDGNNLTILASSGGNEGPFDWLPDGSRLIFFSVRNSCNRNCPPPVELRSIQIQVPKQSTLLLSTDLIPCSAENLIGSPDGSRLLISSLNCDGKGRIYAIKSDGTGLTQIIDSKPIISFTPGSVPHPDWAPNGKFITFESDRDGGFDIYILNIDNALRNPSTQPIRLTDDPSRDYFPTWQPGP